MSILKREGGKRELGRALVRRCTHFVSLVLANVPPSNDPVHTKIDPRTQRQASKLYIPRHCIKAFRVYENQKA